MSGKIDASEENTIGFQYRPRKLTDGPLVITKGPNGEIIEQRIDPEWTSYMKRRNYIAPRVKEGPFSFDIDESGEPVPAPLFPDGFHPLSYCYRLKFDQEDWEPSVYCTGIPRDHEVVIFSDLLPNKTWAELKEEAYDCRDLNRRFPLTHYMLHKREKKEPEKVVQEYNEARKREELKREKEMLTKFIEEDNYILQDDSYVIEPSISTEKNSRTNRNTLPRNRGDKKTKVNASLTIRSYNTPRSQDVKSSKAPAASKKKKAKKERREFTPEERLYFEIHGCSYEQFIDRKQRDIKKQLGIFDL